MGHFLREVGLEKWRYGEVIAAVIHTIMQPQDTYFVSIDDFFVPFDLHLDSVSLDVIDGWF